LSSETSQFIHLSGILRQSNEAISSSSSSVSMGEGRDSLTDTAITTCNSELSKITSYSNFSCAAHQNA